MSFFPLNSCKCDAALNMALDETSAGSDAAFAEARAPLLRLDVTGSDVRAISRNFPKSPAATQACVR